MTKKETTKFNPPVIPEDAGKDPNVAPVPPGMIDRGLVE